MAKRSGGKLAFGAAVAAGIGYLIGVLSAPKSGKETRQEIKTAAQSAMTESEKKLKKVYSDLDKMIADGRSRSLSVKQKAKKELEQAIVKAEKTKQKARGILSAVHEGEADDKDLNSAIKETKSALSHLKQYLKFDDKTK